MPMSVSSMRAISASIALSLIAVLLTGCSAVGYVVGSRIDASDARSAAHDLPDLRPNSPVALRLEDGSTIAGRWQGVTPGDSSGAAGMVAIDTGSSIRRVASDRIASLEARPGLANRITLALMGLVVDVAAVVSMNANHRHH